MQMGGVGGGKVVRCGGWFSDDKRWVGVSSMLSSKHSLGTCLNLLFWAPQGISKTEISKCTCYKLFTTNDFKHNKYNKDECHEPYISSFGINNYKTSLFVPQVVIDWRLCNIKVVAKWVPGKDIHDLHQVFLFLLCSHLWWGKERKKRENRQKKRKRLIPSWGTTIKTPCQIAYLSKALLPNTITLGI